MQCRVLRGSKGIQGVMEQFFLHLHCSGDYANGCLSKLTELYTTESEFCSICSLYLKKNSVVLNN